MRDETIVKDGQEKAVMLTKNAITNEILNPVAIFDKELLGDPSFKIQMFELCTICGARFGIGYHGPCANNERVTDESEDLPKKLTEILTKDHFQHRAHKHFIDLDI